MSYSLLKKIVQGFRPSPTGKQLGEYSVNFYFEKNTLKHIKLALNFGLGEKVKLQNQLKMFNRTFI